MVVTFYYFRHYCIILRLKKTDEIHIMVQFIFDALCIPKIFFMMIKPCVGGKYQFFFEGMKRNLRTIVSLKE